MIENLVEIDEVIMSLDDYNMGNSRQYWRTTLRFITLALLLHGRQGYALDGEGLTARPSGDERQPPTVRIAAPDEYSETEVSNVSNATGETPASVDAVNDVSAETIANLQRQLAELQVLLLQLQLQASLDTASGSVTSVLPSEADVTNGPKTLPPTGSPQTAVQRQSYASGVSVWHELQSSMEARRLVGIELDPAWVLLGLQDMAGQQPLRMSLNQLDTITMTLNELWAEKLRDSLERHQAEGRAYQSAFFKEKGTKRDSGIYYKIISTGKGALLKATDTVSVAMTGSLPDGTVFDASGQHAQSKTVKVNELMPAVAMGLQKVSGGGHIRIAVPPEKGYGDTGLPPLIPGGATLIFDVIVASGL